MNFKKYVQNSPSLTIQCWEPKTWLCVTFAHCFSTFLRERRSQKHKIGKIAVFPILFITRCLKKSEKLSVVFYSCLFYIKLKICNYSLLHNFAMVSHYLYNRKSFCLLRFNKCFFLDLNFERFSL